MKLLIKKRILISALSVFCLLLPMTGCENGGYSHENKISAEGNIIYESEALSTAVNIEGKKLVALTFDDGPNKYFREYLSLFGEYKWHCTFFVLGGYVEPRADIVADCVRAGMEIANHSYSHQSFDSLTDSEIRQELQMTADALKKATDVKAKIKCARLPSMIGNGRIYSATEEFGYVWVGSIRYDIGDGGGLDNDTLPSDISDKILESVYDGAIYCLHAAPNTLKALRTTVLPTLKKRGYACVTVSELFEAKGVADFPNNYSVRDAYLANTDEEVAANMMKYK